MMTNLKKRRFICPSDHLGGFAFVVTLVVLVVLTSLVAGLSVHLTMAKRRQQYMIEYQRARYGADSAMKYILSVLPARAFSLPSRADKPDFSDLFWMNEAEYSQFINDWASTATEEQIEAVLKEGASLNSSEELGSEDFLSRLTDLLGIGGDDSDELDGEQIDVLDANDIEALFGDPNENEEEYVIELDPNDVEVPGPYGPIWPYVMEPIELEIGPCHVSIVIEDENAKMPLSWMVTSVSAANKQAENALKTFCEWMARDTQGLRKLEETVQTAMDEVYKKKMFKLNPSPIILRQTSTRTVPATASANMAVLRRRTRRSQTAAAAQTVTQTTTQERPAVAHTTDFAKLFHSSLLNQEVLAHPLPDTGTRLESPLKYLSLWGAQRVNINTAPRQVLEATFTLAIDPLVASELAHAVIQQRKEKPFSNITQLKDLGRLDSATMNALQNYISTTSTFFQIRITSRSGNARAVAVATVVKEGRQMERLAILYQ
jgi:DNA uptake protein ComE-like DNA-binding protein